MKLLSFIILLICNAIILNFNIKISNEYEKRKSIGYKITKYYIPKYKYRKQFIDVVGCLFLQ